MVKRKSTSVENRRLNNLRIFAKYLAEHQSKVCALPRLPSDHQKYFERCLKHFQAKAKHIRCQQPFDYDFDEPIITVCTIMSKLGHPCMITGEQGDIIRFHKKPLSSLLWMTMSGEEPEGSGKDDQSRTTIRLHTLNTSKLIFVDGTADLVIIFGYVAAFQATFTSNPLDITQRVDLQATKPRRYSDDKLLKALAKPGYRGGQAGYARFTESARQIERGCLLDAVMELLTPFRGLVPRFDSRFDTHFVDFKHTSKYDINRCRPLAEYLGNVRIWRAKDLTSCSGILETFVLISGLTPSLGDSDIESEDEEESRWYQSWMETHGYEVPEDMEKQYKHALSYDLASPQERWELVLRLVNEVDKQRDRFAALVHKKSSDWSGKYCRKERYGPNPRRLAREERTRRLKERRSPLRLEITYEEEESGS